MKRRAVLAGLGGVGALGAGYLGFELFAPEETTTESDDLLADSEDATTLKRGSFTGKDGHECSGTVLLAEDDQGRFLQFREYEQTSGPDVFCYLTPAADPDTGEEIAAGEKVRIDGGEDGGEMTKTGTFAQRLSGAAAQLDAGGVGVWCDDFSVPFGAATLEDV